MAATTTVYTAPEVADILGMNIETVYRRAALGKLPCFYVGEGRGSWRMSDAQLRDWIAERTRANERAVTRLFGPKTKQSA